MKYLIEKQKTNYTNDRVTFSADFVITDDNSVELWRRNVSVKSNINNGDWYADMKNQVVALCQEIKDKYVAKMSQIVADTGQSDIQAIINDITTNTVGSIS